MTKAPNKRPPQLLPTKKRPALEAILQREIEGQKRRLTQAFILVIILTLLATTTFIITLKSSSIPYWWLTFIVLPVFVFWWQAIRLRKQQAGIKILLNELGNPDTVNKEKMEALTKELINKINE